jgi:ATP-dependent Clp protease ATP-binding subunit ClpX
MEGVKLQFTEDALQGVAEEAHKRKSGARGLRAILEEVMLDVMYEIPALSGVTECVVNREVVATRGRPLLVREKKAS